MNTDELQAIVDAAGEGEVSRLLGWSTWTLKRKLRGESAIDTAEGALLKVFKVVRGIEATTGRKIR